MTASITDFSQFSSLRAGADAHDPAVLREVAGQFEALFLQSIFKTMRDSSLAEPIFGQSDQHEMYMEMLDKQYALEMSSGRGIGLADMLVRQLGGEDAEVTKSPRELTSSPGRAVGTGAGLSGWRGLPDFSGNRGSHGKRPLITVRSGPAELMSVPTADSAEVAKLPVWSEPQHFARDLWPHAEKAAKKLNVAPEALVAQAALETGWGKHVLKRQDGSSSFNLFGIKANHGWTGSSVSTPTIEYRDGEVRRERAEFRAYSDLAATFDDYAEFIGGQPRYEAVRDHAEDTAGFANALQESGYATDPGYARKINAILDSNVMRKALQWLKSSAAAPTTSTRSHGGVL